MSEKEAKASGAVGYWALSDETDYGKLLNGLRPLGLEDHVPEPKRGNAALKTALGKVFKRAATADSAIMVRPLLDSETNGFVVVAEIQGEEENSYPKLANARIEEETIILTPPDALLAVQEAYTYQQGILTQQQVASTLVGIVEEMGGTKLRPSGALYWISEEHLDTWDKVTEAVESAACGNSPSSVYKLRTVFDASAIKAVRDAIVAEIGSRSREIAEQIKTPGVGERFFKARAKDAQRLHERIASYEAILGQTMEHLHELADTTKGQVVEAGLQAFPDIFGGKAA